MIERISGVSIHMPPNEMAGVVQNMAQRMLELELISNAGVKEWSDGFLGNFEADHWSWRFAGPSALIRDGCAPPMSGHRRVDQLFNILTALVSRPSERGTFASVIRGAASRWCRGSERDVLSPCHA
jgi:hypothetical protein